MTRKITHNGKTQSIAAWSRETGISKNTILFRINNGWEESRAVTEQPSRSQRKGHPWKRFNPSYLRGMRL